MVRETSLDEFEQLLTELGETGDESLVDATSAHEARIDYEEHDDEYIVTIDLSEYDPSNISAHLDDRTLIVRAEQTEETEGEVLAAEDMLPGNSFDGARFSRHTRRRSTVQKEIAFPRPVDESLVEATVTDGRLTAVIQKV